MGIYTDVVLYENLERDLPDVKVAYIDMAGTKELQIRLKKHYGPKKLLLLSNVGITHITETKTNAPREMSTGTCVTYFIRFRHLRFWKENTDENFFFSHIVPPKTIEKKERFNEGLFFAPGVSQKRIAELGQEEVSSCLVHSLLQVTCTFSTEILLDIGC